MKELPILAAPLQFLKQETISDRGKNTCLPTSFMNCAIALRVIDPQRAVGIHDDLLRTLMAIDDVWDGSFLNLKTADTQVKDIVEAILPIRIGYYTEGVHFYHGNWNYQHLYYQLSQRLQTFTITERPRSHAYAFVSVYGNNLLYVDPMNNEERQIMGEDEFNYRFRRDQMGRHTSQIWAVPIKRRNSSTP
ncbi:MAG: hypothetical protein M1289_02950 [Patescibacteria group bacterium]|nr:hypothetical protein [Patescibacteria group bacterium]